jgi:hypothetical protein
MIVIKQKTQTFMKTKLSMLTVVVLTSLLLFSFISHHPQQKGTEEYAIVVYIGREIHKTVNGKTEVIKLEGEKVEGAVGKNYLSALVKELEKVNAEGYEIVNADVAVGTASYQETYFFRRKK